MTTNPTNPNVENDDIQMLPLIRLCWVKFIGAWKWYLLSVLVCVALAYLYQQRKARVYQRQTVMLIEGGDGSSSQVSTASRKSRGNMSTLLELNGVTVGDNLKNEMFILTSRRLMERVVDTLRLDVDYTVRRSLHDVTLYRDRPFELVFAERAKFAANFKAKIKENGTVELSKFKVFDPARENPEVNATVSLRPGETKQTPAGKLTLKASPAMAEAANGEEITVSRVPVKLAAQAFAGKISAMEYDKESSLIVLSCQDVNADRAEDIVREVYAAYKQDVVDNKNRVAYSTAEFIDERIRIIGDDLSGVENRMARFKRDNQLVDLQLDAQSAVQESQQARQQAIQIETQLAVTQFLADFLQDRSKRTETIPQLSIPQASFATSVAEYNRVMIERNRLAENSSEAAPAVRDLDNQLASMRSSIVASVNSNVKSLQLQLSRARQTENAISGLTGSVPEKEKQGLDIKRQQELKSNLYTYLLNKREEVALQMAINEANVRLVEEPMGSPIPISPRKNMILLLGLFIGLLIPSLIIWLLYVLDTTIHYRREIEDVTTIPIIGDLPHWDKAENRADGLISNEVSTAAIVEAFRVLRYNLNFMRHSAKVFITTSASPGQGKSFISTNLSLIFGSTGKRVLFIDADIRKRTVSKMFGNATGLTSLLSDDGTSLKLSDVVIPGVISENVDFLAAGKMPPNPAEMLMSDRLDEIIDEARQIYDYIVIDTTPALSVADANIVNRVGDITIFVIRMGVQKRDFLPVLEQMYQDKKFRNLCIAINDAEHRDGYGYNYGYTYGYGALPEKQKKSRFSWRKK